MKSLTEDLKENIPPLGSHQGVPLKTRMVHLRYVDHSSSWRWYVLEYDGKDTFFGFVLTRRFATMGQFTLTELQNLGHREENEAAGVERDVDFEPTSVEDLLEEEPAIEAILASSESSNSVDSLVQLE